MSIPVKQTVPCPKCGKDIEFTMWQSINNEMSFAMKDIISGKLFEVECKNCGLKTYVNYPILVNDMAHDVMIQYTYPDGIDESEKALESLRKMYSGKLRIVTDQTTLREKVAIFNADLDDRVVELLKAIVLAQVHDQLADKDVQGVYFIPDDNPRFEIVYEAGSGFIPVNMEFYTKVRDEFSDVLTQNQDYYVDREWAYSILAPGDEE